MRICAERENQLNCSIIYVLVWIVPLPLQISEALAPCRPSCLHVRRFPAT